MSLVYIEPGRVTQWDKKLKTNPMSHVLGLHVTDNVSIRTRNIQRSFIWASCFNILQTCLQTQTKLFIV